MISPFIRLFGFLRLRQKKIVKAWKNLHILESFIFQHQKTKESVFIHFIGIKKVKSCPIGYTGREESCMNNYKILVYEIEVEDGGRVDKTHEDEVHSKKEALQIYKALSDNLKSHNYSWNLENKYKEVEYLIYLYQDFKVIKRGIIKKKERGAQK